MKAHARLQKNGPRRALGLNFLVIGTNTQPMRLHQLKIEFNAEHDRLLVRLATDSAAEVLVWLTRRCVKRLWPLLINMAQTAPEIALQPNPEAKRALLGFQHEKAIRQADFTRPYEEAQRERPLGQNPLLVTRIQPRRDQQGRHVLGLLPTVGQGVHLTLDENLLHGLMKLIQNAVARADWDLALQLPAGMVIQPTEEGGRPSIN